MERADPQLLVTVAMRIAYILTKSSPLGGAQVHVRDLAQYMKSLGHEVHIVVGGQTLRDSGLASQFAAAGISTGEVVSLRNTATPLHDAIALHQVRKELAAFRPDLVATHSSKAGVLGRAAARSLRIPVTFTVHGWAFTEGVPRRQAFVYRLIETLMSRFTDRIIAVSDADRDLAIGLGVARPERITTIHNGVHDVPVRLRATPGVDSNRLVKVARFDKQKDHRTLLLALHGLKDLPWTLDLIGDGPQLNGIRMLTRDLRLENRVRLLGQCNDVAERLATYQCALLISNWEGLPLSILEAMRAGLPVISSDVGGCREAVSHGESGFLVPRGDVRGLQYQLRRVLCDPSLRSNLGANGRRIFEERFQVEQMMDKTVSLYKGLL